MAKIDVLENKKLVLKNVLIRHLENILLEDVEKEINKFTSKLDILNVQTFGPLVVKSCGTDILEDGTINTSYDLIMQAHDYLQYKDLFITHERLTCSHCAYVHYEGDPTEINYVYSKLDLYFYENDLQSSSELYVVYIQEGEDFIIADFFKPVVKS